jgi:hypothetical protein
VVKLVIIRFSVESSATIHSSAKIRRINVVKLVMTRFRVESSATIHGSANILYYV